MKKWIKSFALLYVALFIYSLSGVFSKYAAKQNFFSIPFFVFIGLLFVCLGVYAILWQQVIKKLPLSTAFANKAITIVFGLVLGFAFFSETITVQKIIGSVVIICGVILYVKSENLGGETNDTK